MKSLGDSGHQMSGTLVVMTVFKKAEYRAEQLYSMLLKLTFIKS
jgi:hypothetical protein